MGLGCDIVCRMGAEVHPMSMLDSHSSQAIRIQEQEAPRPCVTTRIQGGPHRMPTWPARLCKQGQGVNIPGIRASTWGRGHCQWLCGWLVSQVSNSTNAQPIAGWILSRHLEVVQMIEGVLPNRTRRTSLRDDSPGPLLTDPVRPSEMIAACPNYCEHLHRHGGDVVRGKDGGHPTILPRVGQDGRPKRFEAH